MISAVILNYLNSDLTHQCVDTLRSAARECAIEIEIIDVDNSAFQTSRELKRKLPKEVIIIENQENLGFAKANNQGFERAAGDIILIMNNDLFISAEVLKKGKQYLENNATTGIWAPKLTDPDGTPQRSCAHFLNLKTLTAEYLFKKPLHTRIAETAAKADQPVEVDMVIGACMFISRNVLMEVGGFDEDYFFTAEDIDLCLQLKRRGYNIIYDPRFAAVHLVGASQDSNWYDDPHLHEGRIRYFQKNHGFVTAGIAKGIIKTGILMRKVKHKIFAG